MRALPLALLLLTLAACDTVGTDAVIVRYTGPAITEADAAVPTPPLIIPLTTISTVDINGDVPVRVLLEDPAGR